MMPLSLSSLAPNRTLIAANNYPSAKPQRSPRPLPSGSPTAALRSHHRPIRTAISAASAPTTASGLQQVHEEVEKPSSVPNSKWGKFASRVSGEWDGYGAEFTSKGEPIELPENVVPEAFREWGVQVFDWQTQCPTLAETGKPLLAYKLIKLLPTVGCEADAATRYSVEERTIGGIDNKVSAFAYNLSGSYVAVWLLKDHNEQRLLELEHCMVDPRNQEVRVRIILNVRVEKTILELQKVKVFSEQWYGPFRNGEQLGGCAIHESGFASTGVMTESEVLGIWQGTSIAASFQNVKTDIIRELVDERLQKLIRDQEDLITLPKQLWCSLKEREDGETWGEVGWLLDHGRAMTSRCVFFKDGSLKAIAIGHEAAVLEDI